MGLPANPLSIGCFAPCSGVHNVRGIVFGNKVHIQIYVYGCARWGERGVRRGATICIYDMYVMGRLAKGPFQRSSVEYGKPRLMVLGA